MTQNFSGKLNLSNKAIKLAAKEIGFCLKEGLDASSAARRAVSAALREDALFDHPIAGPAEARATFYAGIPGSGIEEVQYAWMREAMRCGYTVIALAQTGSLLPFRFNRNEFWLWQSNYRQDDPVPEPEVLRSGKCGIILTNDPIKVWPDPRVFKVLKAYEFIDENQKIALVLTGDLALAGPFIPKILDKRPNWSCMASSNKLSEFGPDLMAIAHQIIEGRRHLGEPEQPGVVRILAGPNMGYQGATPYYGVPGSAAGDDAPMIRSQPALAFENRLRQALERVAHSGHTQLLNTVSRAAGYADWHAAQGRITVVPDWT